MLSKLCHYVPKKTCVSVYFSLFNSHVPYGCLIWYYSTQQNIDQIIKLQKWCIQIVTYRGYSIYWGMGTFLQGASSARAHFVCLHPKNRCHFLLFLMKVFFQNLYHQIGCDNCTQQRSRIGPGSEFTEHPGPLF